VNQSEALESHTAEQTEACLPQKELN